MSLIKQNNKLTIHDQTVTFNNRILFQQTNESPILFLGHGEENIKMYRGNFDIHDHVEERIPLTMMDITEENEFLEINFGFQEQQYVTLKLQLDDAGRLLIQPTIDFGEWNRLWIRIKADENENVYGAGEQMSHFNLRGRHFPLWTSEPGIGRNKKNMTTFLADAKDHAGGDYYTTNYPETTFVSTNHYYCHTDSYYYADFDFSNNEYHELQYWGIPDEWIFETAETYVDLIGKLSNLLGRQFGLPDWTNDGINVGLQGGTERINTIIKTMKKRDVKIAGIWVQDWEGTQTTSFGKRNYWNWHYDDQLYPGLPSQIKTWHEQGMKFLGYINPYVVNGSPMFEDGRNGGYFAKNQDGRIYLVDFGEFECAVVDFTNPEAFIWFKTIIKVNLIDAGLDGWMADFGEYLPTDVVLHDHSDPMVMHNKWPMLWAKCNYEAVHESGKQDDIVYFMRAGAAGSQTYNQLLWAGDQSVNWSLDDGLASTIPAALSAGMTGNTLTHSDIGGYTSMYGNVRDKELFMRWAEMAAFTPFMRSHEGNRPASNFQVYNDDGALDHLAKFTKIFQQLKPYRQTVIDEAVSRGLPAQRPLFMHYEDDVNAYDIQYEYLFGRDLLVAPVYEADQVSRHVYLPNDEWINLWTGEQLTGGDYDVEAQIGRIPVFYRRDSPLKPLFEKLKSS